MNKKSFSFSIIEIALALVLTGGALQSARADCGLSLGCLPRISLPHFSLCRQTGNTGDKDKAPRDTDYSYSSGPTHVDRDLMTYHKIESNVFGDDCAYNSVGRVEPDSDIRDSFYKLQPSIEEKGLFSHKRG